MLDSGDCYLQCGKNSYAGEHGSVGFLAIELGRGAWKVFTEKRTGWRVGTPLG